MVKYRLGELFSGPGGLSYGAMNAKVLVDGEMHEIVHQWASDYDEDSCKTFSRNICKTESGIISDSVHHTDVKHLDIASLDPIDILAFGFPCNDFSHVGESKGMEGDFGMLYEYGVKALNLHNPMAFVAENVSGINSSDEGRSFAKILRELRNAGECGYHVTSELHPFEHLGVPQARHRYIIVGIRKDLNKEYNMHAHTHIDDLVSSMEAITDPPVHLAEFGIKGKIPDGHPNHKIREPDGVVKRRLEVIPEGENAWCDAVENDPDLRINTKTKLSSIYRRLDRNKPAYTVTGSGGGGTHMYHWEDARALTNREKARLQTFPDDYRFWGGVTSVRKQIGMAVPPYGAKLIFEMLLVALADSPSLKIMSDVEPKKATFWKHPIQWHENKITSLIDDLSATQMQKGRLMILIPNLAKVEVNRFEDLLNLCISKNCVVQCILNDAWKDGIETTSRDMLVELQESSSLISVRSSFIKGNSAVVMFQDKKGTLNSIYAPKESTNLFFQMKKISFNKTLALHIETLFNEEHFSELPLLSGIGTAASKKKKIQSDLSKFNQLASHRSRIPANMPNPTESIDLLELARRSPVSSFNLEFGRGRRRDGSAGPRRWTEIELTIGTRYPKLPNEFEAHTHDGKVLRIDGKVLKLKRSGGSAKLGKDLATEGNRHLFGAWMKGLLYQSGALREGERITEATFEVYGKTTLDFYKIDENVFFLDFEPKPDKIE